MLILGRLSYTWRTAIAAILASPGLSALTALSMGVALLLMGIYTTAVYSIRDVALVWGQSFSMDCYLDETLPAAQWPYVQQALQQLPGVQRATLVTPDESLENFRHSSAEAATLLDGIMPDILPATVQLTLHDGFADVAAVRQLADAAKHTAGVQQVDFGEEEYTSLARFIKKIGLFGAVLMLFLVLGSGLMVANTIALALYTYRDEMIVLKLVGASDSFIYCPYLLQGTLWGVLGGVFAIMGLYVADILLLPHVQNILGDVAFELNVRVITMPLCRGIVLLGICMGFVGSAFALWRLGDMEKV